ncbi:MAG: PIG-L deacetylase family protein [Promethearchaeota archaeon]
MAKIIFFQAHPDDLEHKCGHIMHYLAKKSKNKHKIKIASMTRGEFGLPGPQYDKFKGNFLAKVRTKELFNAESIHGIPPKNIYFFGYIDGFVPFNREIVNKITNYINREKPDVIFAPEPIYTWYYHMDHINTGRAVFYAIYHKLINFSPNLYFYTSLNPNFYFGVNNIDLTYQLLACHKTQRWLLNKTLIPYKPFSRFHSRKLSGWKYAEPFRRVYFNKENQNKNKPSFLTRIFSHFFSSLPWMQAKYPQDLLAQLKMK